MSMQEADIKIKKVAVVDFGSQYTQLIWRKVREIGLYSEIVKPDETDRILTDTSAIILSGGPYNVNQDNALFIDRKVVEGDIPVLGICYGLQLIVYLSGGEVQQSTKMEFGPAALRKVKEDEIFDGVDLSKKVWMSHKDKAVKLPPSLVVVASSSNSPYAVIKHKSKKIYGLQFHPEVRHTEEGKKFLSNFLFKIAKLGKNWDMNDYVNTLKYEIENTVGNGYVMLALSGGVDSSTLAYLLARTIDEKKIYPVFINTGLLKSNAAKMIERHFGFFSNLRLRDESALFINRLKGIKDPEKKRKIIGRTFIDLFTEEIKNTGKDISFLAQGTLYPDIIESGGTIGTAKVIKSHHNVGGLPDNFNLKLLEPFKKLFKDEVRIIGQIIGVPDEILYQHPFPGPGFAIRIIGEVSQDGIAILQHIDSLIEHELKKSGIYNKIWQAFPILLPVKTVGVKGDTRSYENVCVIRAVDSIDGMTCDWSKLDYSVLDRMSSRIVNEVAGVNRVVYDITTKPPATIEWE